MGLMLLKQDHQACSSRLNHHFMFSFSPFLFFSEYYLKSTSPSLIYPCPHIHEFFFLYANNNLRIIRKYLII